MDCIFCKIIAGELPSFKVYEDDSFLAFMDIAPMAKGHTLVIPKTHCRNVFDTPDSVAINFYKVIAKVAKAVKIATGADGINILQANEPAAGQVVFHSHVHIIPRFEGDRIALGGVRLELDKSELENISNQIKNNI